MRTKLLFPSLLGSLILLGGCDGNSHSRPKSPEPKPEYDFSAVETRCQQFLDESDVYDGLSFTFVDMDQGVVHEAALGDHTLDIVVLLASASKMPVAATLMALNDDESLDFDVEATIDNYLYVLRDAYGMTENFVQVRLSDNGEIQFKSKGLMKGYYLNEEKTAEVFDDGWYCTGDSGKFDEDGNLWVTGRVSKAFNTPKGKFIVPTRLEDHFGRSPILAQFCVMGHGFDQPVLLTTLSETGTTLDKETVKTERQALLDEVNAEVPVYERVVQIYVTPEWTIENTLLTPTMKLKRNQIEQAYRDRIEQSLSGDRVIFL